MTYKNVRPSKFYIGGKSINEIADANVLFEEANEKTGVFIHDMMAPALDMNVFSPSVRARMAAMMFGAWEERTIPQIAKVIFNDPATIVLWNDGTKTVVKAQNEAFDKEKGLAMAIAKKAMGNRGNYFEEFKKWTV